MTVTGITNVAVSFRIVTPHANASAVNRPKSFATDSVELSQQAAAEARTTDSSLSRAETSLKALDTDRDGVVSKTEFTEATGLAIRRYTNLPRV